MTFITKTITSNYLGRDFEVSCWEKGEDGRKLTIIEHAAFEDIIFNQLIEESITLEYSLEPIIGISNYPVMKCTMKDNSGRCVIAIGEAHPNSLVNDISRQNPVIMAGNRAFDRAAIRFLNFEGKVYSSEEIPSDEEKTPVSTVSDVIIDEREPVTDPGSTIVNFGKKYRGQNKTVAWIWENDASWAEYAVNKMDREKAGKVTLEQIEALQAYGKIIGKLN